MSDLKVFSGGSCMCDVGIAGVALGFYGEKIEIHTGDIAIAWYGSYLGTDIEQWSPHGLSAVVAEQYRTFTNGTIECKELPLQPFLMGIKGCTLNDPEWRVQVVKKYYDVVLGEHWPDYGFSYQLSDVAEEAKRKGVK